MKMTPHQLRAARGIANLTVGELADLAGVSRDTVSDFEAGLNTPIKRTVEALWRVLEARGIELVGTRGAVLRDDNLRVIEGEGCYLKLLECVLSTLRGSGADICFYCIDDRLSTDAVTDTVKLMRKDGLTTRFICEEGNTHILFPRTAYRWIPTRFFQNDVQVVFGDYVGTLIDKGAEVYLVHNASYAQTQRNIFDFLWFHCKMPPTTTAPVAYD